MFTKILVGVSLLFISSLSFAQGDCRNIDTFPTTQVPNPSPTLVPVPKCIAGCPTVRPPRCADADNIFPPVNPKSSKAVSDYSAVVCTDISTFPTVTHDNKVFPKCVQKCQGVRPPKCVDYNRELK